MALFSIIVPVYNVATCLQTCIQSILNQSFTDYELLLVDDGSIDGSGAICDQLAGNETRIRVFHKDNGGVSSARNLGLRNATGEWICFVDADDLVLEGGLQQLADRISDDVDMVWGGYEVFNEQGERTYAVSDRITESLTNEEGLEMLFLPRYYRYLGFVCGRLLRRTVIDSWRISFDEDLYYNEDRLFFARFMCASEAAILFTTTPVYGYIEQEKSAMGLLKKGFNLKFTTDLTAMVRMREIIRSKYAENEKLQALVDSACYASWRRMVGMKGYADSPWRVRAGIVERLIKGLGLKRFLQLDWARNRNRIRKLIRKYK